MSHRLRRAAAIAAAVVFVGVVSPRTFEPPAIDRGAAGVWQRLRQLQTTASAMHLTAHPDDEQGGVLARLARRDGVRVTMLTLTRGEAGDNAIGPELFDALGLIRTEELRRSNEYYGVARQYFTSMADYGFSKRLDEAFEKWGRDAVLRDMVRVVRTERPWVLISRFQGTARDGHGNHQTSGLIAQDVFKLAGDPNAFPEQMKEGLRPWQPMKLYTGGWRENEEWHVRVDSGEYDAWIGESYANLAARGFAFQRSQNGGRTRLVSGPVLSFHRREASTREGTAREDGFFDGIDTSLAGVFRALGRPAPPRAEQALSRAAAEVATATKAFSASDPSRVVPSLARGLSAVRDAIAAAPGEADALVVIRQKEQQFEEAIALAAGLEASAIAQAAGTVEQANPFASPPLMADVVPGDAFQVRASIIGRARAGITIREIGLEHAAGWAVARMAPAHTLELNRPWTASLDVRLAQDAPLTSQPPFQRASIQDSVYTLSDPRWFGLPAVPPATLVATCVVEGVEVRVRTPVLRRESHLPYGIELREVKVVPALSVTSSPTSIAVPLARAGTPVDVDVEVVNNRGGGSTGELRLALPTGWSSTPAVHAFVFANGGERARFRFSVTPAGLEARAYDVGVVATSGGREYREGYTLLQHRDLEPRYLYRPSTVTVRGIDVATAAGLRVGYVMGVGDQVPSGISQLGATVSLLSAQDLASADLSAFDTIVTGTRAYAVRDDLRTYNQRLLDYVKGGGNLVVLYNTQEYSPGRFAPFPGELTASAEEVSEEDSPVEILQPSAPVLSWPNRITAADFDGWVEQRGSKFWSTWADGYTPMIATHDKGQAPQRGGWLQAKSGKGTFTYFAYAFHRQLPYGVPGAYRLLANVLALGKSPR